MDVCQTCQKPKANLVCGCCHEAVCKGCAQFVAEDAFDFMPVVPPELKRGVYCGVCFDRVVAPEREAYERQMEAARNIQVFFDDQGKETRFLKRKERPVEIKDCADRDETVLRLAFIAAGMGYTGVIDVGLKSEKVRVGGYQTLKWSGRGIPAMVKGERLVKDRSIWSNPN